LRLDLKTLIVEDDFITSQVLREIMLAFGETDIAENGLIAIDMIGNAINADIPYNLIFLDIMMPELDGQEALTLIRQIEKDSGIIGLDCSKVLMTTALSDFSNIKTAFKNQCEGYIIKPIEKDKIINTLTDLRIIE
jgi:two-component system chemotaxis response regulator CheY